jgi:phosphomannomutase
MSTSSIFKAYDIRGIYPGEINEEIVYKIGQAYVEFVKPKIVVVGKDVRISSPSLCKALINGILDAGVDVVDIGTISTDMLYFTVAKYGYDGGLIVSASHNPREWNGVKMVKAGAAPISADTGIIAIRDIVLKGEIKKAKTVGTVQKKDIWDDYVQHVLSFVDSSKIKPLKVVMNANFGMAGVAATKICKNLPIEIVPLNFEPDGNFPKGRPDPLIPENRVETSELVRTSKADLAVAWDADADRCFFFDEHGCFVPGVIITALLAESFLLKHPGEKILHCPRVVWPVIDTVLKYGGIPLENKVGHSFFKERMRKENAIFGGEMSAHYYFRDNFYADNGMIPMLLIFEFLGMQEKKFSELVHPFFEKYFFSGEINFQVEEKEELLQMLEKKYSDGKISHLDGLTIEYDDWRFNIRPSNTEPLVRLNIEAKSQKLMEEKREELSEFIKKR